MAVEADLGLVPDLVDQRADPGLRLAEDERAGRVDDVNTLGTAVYHDAGLPGELFRADPVREHEEPDGLHAHVAGRGEVLQGNVGLGAVGRDPGD